MKNTIVPSIICDNMVSEDGFEFALEKANFWRNFRKNKEEKSCGVFLRNTYFKGT